MPAIRENFLPQNKPTIWYVNHIKNRHCKITVWLLVFVGTNFQETGQSSVSELLAVLIFTVGESGIHAL